MLQLKNERSGSKIISGFSIILILAGIKMFQNQSAHAFCWTKMLTFINPKGTENGKSLQTFTDPKLVLQLIQESRIKNKIAMSWRSRKIKRWLFVACSYSMVFFWANMFYYPIVNLQKIFSKLSKNIYFYISQFSFELNRLYWKCQRLFSISLKSFHSFKSHESAYSSS